MNVNAAAALTAKISIAPMIDWTNQHFRFLMRLILPQALLYTEMQTIAAIAFNPEKALKFNALEQPLALQVGGADPKALAKVAVLAEDRGFAEINLNLGCPSARVQAGRFGACLMKEPQLVQDCIGSMKSKVNIPVTAKTRIGIDLEDSFEFFQQFALVLQQAGCDKLIIHARKAWLKGLTPKQNRTIPPIQYSHAYRLKTINAFQKLPIVLNGNIKTLADVRQHGDKVDGFMIGRAACDAPFGLQVMHQHFYPHVELKNRLEIFAEYLDHMKSHFNNGTPLTVLLKPIFNFASGLAFSKKFKQTLLLAQKDTSIEMVKNTIEFFKSMH